MMVMVTGSSVISRAWLNIVGFLGESVMLNFGIGGVMLVRSASCGSCYGLLRKRVLCLPERIVVYVTQALCYSCAFWRSARICWMDALNLGRSSVTTTQIISSVMPNRSHKTETSSLRISDLRADFSESYSTRSTLILHVNRCSSMLNPLKP